MPYFNAIFDVVVFFYFMVTITWIVTMICKGVNLIFKRK